MLIYPQPQWLKQTHGICRIPLPLQVANTGNAGMALTVLNEQNIAVEIAESDELATIFVSTLDNPLTRKWVIEHDLNIPAELQREGGYILDIRPDRILAAGFDPAGTFYAVQSLAQLFKPQASSKILELPCLTVYDWPYKPMRGVHLYMPGRDQVPFFKQWLRWLAGLKYNTVFIETGGGMEYRRHPEVNAAWEKFCQTVRQYPGGGYEMERSQPFVKMSSHIELGGGSYLRQEEVRELVEYARSLHFNVIPEMPSLSHAYYLCVSHPVIAERQDDPFPDTYCPSDPRSYALLFDLLEEVIEVFQPRIIHMGHDEIIHLGICPRCQDKSGVELVGGDINRIHDFLSNRGVRMAIWGDKLLPIVSGGRWHAGMELKPENSFWAKGGKIPETYPVIHAIPKDILVLNWYWGIDRQSSHYLTENGFDVLLGNIGENFTQQGFDYRWDAYSAPPKIVGGEVSTWCEISESEFSYFGVDFTAAFCAQMLWWSHYRDSDRGVTSAKVAEQIHLLRAMRAKQDVTVETGTPIPIPLPESSITGVEFGPLPDDLPFALSDYSQVIQIDQNNKATEIPAGWYAGKLLFLHGCATRRYRNPPWDVEDASLGFDHLEIARYEIHYEAGESEEIPMLVGENVATWDVPYGESLDTFPYWVDPVPAGRNLSGQAVTLYRFEWNNPHPERRIEKISLSFQGGPSEIAWLAAISKI